jgi:hypothetical protein
MKIENGNSPGSERMGVRSLLSQESETENRCTKGGVTCIGLPCETRLEEGVYMHLEYNSNKCIAGSAAIHPMYFVSHADPIFFTFFNFFSEFFSLRINKKTRFFRVYMRFCSIAALHSTAQRTRFPRLDAFF